MQYYRCKCGNSTAYGSMSPPRCFTCDKCDTKLSLYPESDCMESIPHKYFDEQVETNDGMNVLTRCMYCGLTKREIEKE